MAQLLRVTINFFNNAIIVDLVKLICMNPYHTHAAKANWSGVPAPFAREKKGLIISLYLHCTYVWNVDKTSQITLVHD